MNILLKYDKYISFGNTCYISKYLKTKGIREEAYPFDWLISNISFITYLLDNSNIDEKIDLIFKIENLVIKKSNKKNHIVYLYNIYKNIKYGYKGKIRFYHDFYNNTVSIENQLKGVKEKYKRRLERLIDILKKNDKSKLFMTWTQNFNINDYKILGNILINQNYKNFDFIIIVRKKYIRDFIQKISVLFKYILINNNLLYILDYDKFKIYLLIYKDIDTIYSSLNTLLY